MPPRAIVDGVAADLVNQRGPAISRATMTASWQAIDRSDRPNLAASVQIAAYDSARLIMRNHSHYHGCSTSARSFYRKPRSACSMKFDFSVLVPSSPRGGHSGVTGDGGDQSSKRAALPVAAPKSSAFSNRYRGGSMNALCA
jgi:hypothetical protein